MVPAPSPTNRPTAAAGAEPAGVATKPSSAVPYDPRTSASLKSRAADAGCTSPNDEGTSIATNHRLFFMAILLRLPVVFSHQIWFLLFVANFRFDTEHRVILHVLAA